MQHTKKKKTHMAGSSNESMNPYPSVMSAVPFTYVFAYFSGCAIT